MQSKTVTTRDHILAVGRELMSDQGFNALGLGSLLKSAKVPKGSFYHYFESKEDFGCKLLEQYVETYLERLDALWSDSDRPGRERLLDYFDRWIVNQSGTETKSQCLIVKLGAEISDMSETMRAILASGTTTIIKRIEKEIISGIEDGSLPPNIDPSTTANMLYQMWLGASLLAKLNQSDAPFRLARANTETFLPTA